VDSLYQYCVEHCSLSEMCLIRKTFLDVVLLPYSALIGLPVDVPDLCVRGSGFDPSRSTDILTQRVSMETYEGYTCVCKKLRMRK
jgi:hypothetical protein